MSLDESSRENRQLEMAAGKGGAKKPRAAKKMPDAPTFEAAMAELESILDKMSGEGTALDESIALYARAAALIKACANTLQDARLRVEEIAETLQEAGAEGIDDV